MIKIVLQNLQAISNAEIDIEEKSITEFVGNNSNGKSILVKTVQALTSGDIRRKEVRRALIKDGTSQGLIAMAANNQQLIVILGEEIRDSAIMYVPNANTPDKVIKRGLGDKQGCETILHKFGFRTYNSGDICLQLSPTFGAIPFITTSSKVNGEIVSDIITDKVAQEFLDSFKNITYPIFRSRLASARKEKENLETIIATVGKYDWRAYQDLADRINNVINVIKHYKSIEVPEIPIPPLGFTLGQVPVVREIPIPVYIPKAPRVGFLENELDELISVYNGICPTCKRPFFEHKENSNETC